MLAISVHPKQLPTTAHKRVQGPHGFFYIITAEALNTQLRKNMELGVSASEIWFQKLQAAQRK